MDILKTFSKIKCSVCKNDGHNKRSCKINNDQQIDIKATLKVNVEVEPMNEDNYSEELLKEQFELHKSYVKGRIDTTITPFYISNADFINSFS